MSIKNVTWALKTNGFVHGSDRMVLLVMAESASDKEASCWLAVAEIARRADMSKRNAQYCLRRLERDGYIRPTGLHFSGTVIYEFEKGRKPLHRGGAEPCTGEVQRAASKLEVN